MLELSSKEREELKKAQLELLDELNSFCSQNDIQFYLFGGTLLGAIRHKGFIPWDDDIDVCMPRDDYNKFCSLYQENDKYFLQNTNTDKHYFYHFSKLQKKNTIYDEYYTQKLNHKKGIFIDIFPVNGYPDSKNKLSSFWYKFWLFVFNKKSYPLKVCKIKKLKRNIGYILMTTISWILLWWCPYHLAAKMRNRFMRKHQYPKSKNCIVGTNLRKIYSRDDFTGKSEVVFEGRTMPAMGDVTGYLTKMYGDYMALPPVSEQVPHHYLVKFKA